VASSQSGGLQGLANKFAQSGQENAFQSWVGMGENEAISSNQIQNALGSEQVNALAARMGIDPAQASNFLAEYLPKIVDKLSQQEKSIQLRTISRDWQLCFHRFSKAFQANRPATAQRAHNITAAEHWPSRGATSICRR
jgi:YidB-like protein